MEIRELNALSETDVADLVALMKELNPNIYVSGEMLRSVVEAPGSHLFAVVDEGHIIGCGTLFQGWSPTGRKAHIEDVVVLSSYRGRHIGRAIMEHILAFARNELAPVDVYLTSHPTRVAANQLYLSLGFLQKETNCYKLELK